MSAVASRDGGAKPLRNARAWFRAALTAVLLASVGLFMAGTWHWPLVGDASLMQYAVLLMRHGMTPYRDIVDVNMPGSYAVAWFIMRAFGEGAVALRLFDFALLFAGGAAMMAIALPYDWLAGLFAAALLMLIHGRDGIAQAAQRDMVMAVLLLAAYAFVFYALRKDDQSQSDPARCKTLSPNRSWVMLSAFAFGGICAGAAITIKPTIAPMGLALLAMAAFTLQGRSRPWRLCLFSGVLGLLAPPVIMFAFMARNHAWMQFLESLRGVVSYHAQMHRLPASYFLGHGIPPALRLLAFIWLAMVVFRKLSERGAGQNIWRVESWEGPALFVGFALGFLSLYAQGKGYPYHRYPLEAFLLLLAGLEFTRRLARPAMPTLSSRARAALSAMGIAGLAFGAFWLAPSSAVKAAGYDWSNQDFMTRLQTDLNHLGGAELSGHVQCMDTTAGCIATLYRMHLVQSTGFLYDCYMMAADQNEATQKLRKRFFTAIDKSPPQVFIITNQLCVNGPTDYSKLRQWPQFGDYLEQNYSLDIERFAGRPFKWWGQPEPSFGYRIYVRRAASRF